MRELFQFDIYEEDKATVHAPSAQKARAEPLRPKRSLIEQLANSTAPTGALLQQLSLMSPMSLVAKYMALDNIARELFEERAAILEYDAGLPRPEAEAEAFRMVMQAYRDPG